MTTVDDLKAQYSMREVVEKFGISINRSGFCVCPFHTEKTASLKVYPDSFYCFGCHKHGDIITFVQLMNECSFKEAVKFLGGDVSGKLTDAAIMRIAKRKREKRKREELHDKALNEMRSTNDKLHDLETVLKSAEPFSDEWCAAINERDSLRERADMATETYLDVIDDWR